MPLSGSVADSTQQMGDILQSLMQQSDRSRSRGQGQGTVGNTDYKQLDPAQGSDSFRNILEQINSRVSGLQAPSYESLLQQGINSPLLQAVLGPALAKLQPGAEDSRQALMDQFRSAGALGSSAQGVAGAKNENNIMGQQGSLIGQIISQMLPQMTQGLNQQFQNQMSIPSLLAQVLGQTRPDTVSGSNVPPGANNQGSVNIGRSNYGMGGGADQPNPYIQTPQYGPPGQSNPGGGLDYNLQDLMDQINGGGNQLDLGGGLGSFGDGGYDPFDDGYGSSGSGSYGDFAEEY